MIPTKVQIFQHWRDWLDRNGFDWGEPSCWACGRWWGTKYDARSGSTGDIRRAWTRVPLQRCHIVPRSLGGSDDPENLFLMCRECHDQAPDTPFREAFFAWRSKQNWGRRRMRELEDVLGSFDISLQDEGTLVQLNHALTSRRFEAWAGPRLGLHGDQAGRGVRLKVATFVAVLLEYVRMKSAPAKMTKSRPPQAQGRHGRVAGKQGPNAKP